ncbi:hypothetical protein SporoP37_01090 [Sporosarcina sp. P37]|uniref:DUF2922 domain-containing protein n=1 Tax=unclassified Sporosarcina TaxID=2647733 RepID=UPI0009C0A1D3|nr:MULTISPECIES: DUF2922 domain-containing protein [unclassified Sporosarcina]ARD46898.1 hypothetical protein SporoP33_00690 [Sporosarcina sp. P33]ARK23423.1 hypothetical protein SporoP37_01090 [Sporosarcina sp. P37]PID18633.1 DUF2922 domain-containing protein [Sporosarcina sp. P35]
MEKVLELTFLTADGKPVKLTVDEPREDLTTEQVESAMQQIIASNVFIVEESPLAAIKGARTLLRETQTLVTR